MKTHFLLFLFSGFALSASPSFSFAESTQLRQPLPRACFQSAIEDATFGSSSEPSRLLATCRSSSAEPVRGALKITNPKLITEVADDYNLISDCLDLNGAFYFAKINAESAFQVNTFGNGGDGGIGQLTHVAIEDVNTVLPEYLFFIRHSEKQSCQSLANLLSKKLNNKITASSDVKHRCELINSQENPLRNLLYTMIFNDLNRRSVDQSFHHRGIEQKLQQAGLSLSAEELEKLKGSLALMGYNAGGANMVKDLSAYLETRIDFITRKSDELWKLHDLSKKPAFLKYVTAEDLDIEAGLTKYKEKRLSYLQELTAQWGEKKARTQYELWLRNLSASELSFSEWLWVWQESRGIAYLRMVESSRASIEQKMGVGVCTSSQMNLLAP